MIKIKYLNNIPKDKQLAVQALAESCMANEESMNTGEICWFISERFCQRFKNRLIVYDETKKDGIRGISILHLEKQKTLTVSHVYVKRKFRSKGIATSMLKAVLKLSKQLKQKTIALKVNPRNAIALKLYSKLGFIPEPEQAIRMSISLK